MTHRHRESRYDAAPNLTPLVDVVLVVLIFLMLGGAMAAGPRVLKATVPPVGGGPSAGVPQPTSLELRVLEDPPSGSFIVFGPGFRVAGNVEQLREALSERQRAFVAAGMDPSQIRVIIRPARNVAYQHVLNVYETVRRAQFTNVAFGATH